MIVDHFRKMTPMLLDYSDKDVHNSLFCFVLFCRPMLTKLTLRGEDDPISLRSLCHRLRPLYLLRLSFIFLGSRRRIKYQRKIARHNLPGMFFWRSFRLYTKRFKVAVVVVLGMSSYSLWLGDKLWTVWVGAILKLGKDVKDKGQAEIKRGITKSEFMIYKRNKSHK